MPIGRHTVIVVIRKFRDAVNGALGNGSLTSHTLKILKPSKKCFVSRSYVATPGDTIHVRAPGAILEFKVEGRGSDYQLVGIALTRANVSTGSGALFLSTADKPVRGSPFSKVGLQARSLKLRDAFVLPPRRIKKSAKLYKFTLFIQRLSDGAIGIIDPFLENEN